METILYSAAIVMIFGAVIAFHEAGHFIIAKLGGMKVHEFAMGMGPVLFSITRGETQYSLRAVPVGGFVRIAGLEPDDPDPEGFNSKPRPWRIGVIAAGPIMNIILAALIFCVSYSVFGRPDKITPQVSRVLAGKPAALAGFQAGDTILEINHVGASDLLKLRDEIANNPGRTISVLVDRKGEKIRLKVVPEKTLRVEYKTKTSGGKLVSAKKMNNWVGQIGIYFTPTYKKLPVSQAIKQGLLDTANTLVMIWDSFSLLFNRNIPAELKRPMGPVGIVGMMYDQVRTSWLDFLNFGGMFSVMVAFFNLIPFPALDGSRIVFIVIEAIRRRAIDPRKEALVHTVGLVILLVFVLLVTVNDIWVRWIKPQ